MPHKPPEYLGDSVYAEWWPGEIRLTTHNGYHDDPRNVIIMDSEVLAALVRFIAQNEGR